MEQVGLSVEAGPRDHLDQEYQLDFGSHAELEADGFDFGQDGTYDQAEHVLYEEISDDAVASDSISKLGYEGEGPRAENADDEPLQTEVTQDARNNAGAEVQYEDEIGYEDDDLVTSGANVESVSAGTAGTDAGLLHSVFQGRSEPLQQADDSHTGMSTDERDAVLHEDLEFEEPGGSMEPNDGFADAGADADGGHAANLAGPDGATVDEFHDEAAREQDAPYPEGEPHSPLSEADKAIEDLNRALADMPDIEVVYKEERYSLLGTPEDDPDSYFLSDSKELDRPLSQFLSALRAVISNEISPADELVIRFDPLDLEFGERSNEIFLNHSFREVLDCHTALAAKEASISADPVIHLMVRRDCEEHFRELLADAKFGDDHPGQAEAFETSESRGDESSGPDNWQVQDELSEDEYPEEHHGNGEDIVIVRTHHHVVSEVAEKEDNEPELETPPGHVDTIGEQTHSFEADASGSQYPNLPAESVHGEEEALERQSSETHSDEHPEDALGGEQDWAEEAAEDGAGTSEHDLRLGISDQENNQQAAHLESNGSGEATEFSAPDEITAPEGGGSKQGAGSNGSVSGAGQKPGSTSQQAAAQASSSTTVPEDEFWEIDYSDDEYEWTPSPTLANGHHARGRPELCPSAGRSCAGQATIAHLDPGSRRAGSGRSSSEPHERVAAVLTVGDMSPPVLGPRARDARALDFDMTSHMSRAGSRCSELGDASRSFSSSIHANMPADEDDDIVLAFDDDTDLAAAPEAGDEYEEYTITYEAAENLADDAGDIGEPHIPEDTRESTGKNAETGLHVAAAPDTASVGTSTTFDGDEIDYNEQNAADHSFTPADDGAQQSAAAAGDEIDWENDGDEYEQQAAGADEDVGYEEPKEAALTPSSLAGKRSRTDETESLADETDYKRRRT